MKATYVVLAAVALVVVLLVAFFVTTHLQRGKFFNAVGANDVGTVDQMLARGADVDSRTVLGLTPLHLATMDVRRADKDMVELLISRGADVNAKNETGTTPLHYAAVGRKDLVELLIASGADVNARATDGTTPLKTALLYSQKDIAELLRRHGATE